MYLHHHKEVNQPGNCAILYNTTAGCREPIPPSRGSIENFQTAAEGATITYNCSPGLVPQTQMSAVCTNTAWRPDPATLECREPLPGELGEYILYLVSGSLWRGTKSAPWTQAFFFEHSHMKSILPKLHDRKNKNKLVCANMAWRPDPATLECREPGEYCMW